MTERNLREDHPQLTGREIFWSVKKIADILGVSTEYRNEGLIYQEIATGRAMEGKTLTQLIEASNELRRNEVPQEFGPEYRQAIFALSTWIHALEDVKKRVDNSI